MFFTHPVIKSTHRTFKLTIVILFIAIVIGMFLRIEGASRIRTFSHDDAFTYLIALGHQDSYAKALNERRGVWTSASEWKKIMQVSDRYCFKKIRDEGIDNIVGKATADLSPPLYYWMLHVWSVWVGVALWTGASLNILIALLTALFLFILARDVLEDSNEAAFVVFLWFLSAGVITVTLQTRMYEFLALLTVLLVWRIIRCSDLTTDFKFWDFLLLALIPAAGLLTHYYFLLVISGVVVFSIVRLANRDRYRLIKVILSIGAGHLIFFLFHPKFYLTFIASQQSGMLKSYDLYSFDNKILLLKLEQILSNLLSFFVLRERSLKFIFLIGLLFFALWIIVMYSRKRSSVLKRIKEVNLTGLYILFFFLWLSSGLIAIFLLGASPLHTMGNPRYLGIVWPFYAFIPVFILRLFNKHQTSLIIVLCVSVILSSSMSVFDMDIVLSNRIFGTVDTRSPDPSSLLQDSDMIVVDTMERGTFTRIFWHVPDDKLIYVGPHEFLLANPGLWLNRLTNNSIVVAWEWPQQEILDLINTQYNTIPVNGGIWGVGSVFKIQKK